MWSDARQPMVVALVVLEVAVWQVQPAGRA